MVVLALILKYEIVGIGVVSGSEGVKRWSNTLPTPATFILVTSWSRLATPCLRHASYQEGRVGTLKGVYENEGPINQ